MTSQNAIYLIMSLIGVILSISTFAIGRTSASKTEGRQDGQKDGQILTELGYLKSSMDAIMRRLDKVDERNIDYVGRITIVEESAKSAHKRLDQICAGMAKHEAI